ncbi:MAG: PHP domain-containing protein [Lentisphaeria bacterium]|nr:PHP domain-containing protein [Lentisphaeria bacterium]
MIDPDSITENYWITPRIVRSEKVNQIKIIPRYANARFDRADKISSVELYPVSGLTSNHVYSQNPESTLKWQLHDDGSMSIEAFFAGEQEYSLLVKMEKFGHPEGVRCDRNLQFSFYALAGDLYGKYPFRGDLHMHSEQSDGELSPEALAARGRELGFDFLAITDHGKYTPSLDACKAFDHLPAGLLVCPGEEVQLADTPVHIVNFGGEFSVNETAGNDLERYKKDALALAKKMHSLTPGNDPFPVGAAQWAFDQIRKGNGLSIFCHCFWQRQHYMINEAITHDIIKNCCFDAMEVISGHGTRNFWSNNLQHSYYEEYANKSEISAVGCSDTHSAYLDNEFGCVYTVCWAEELTRKSIIENIRSGWSVAAEEMTNQSPRFYGSFRLIRYASFLRKHYFPQHDKLCAAEGILLNEVLAGNQKLIPAVKLAADAVENYRKTLFIV